MPALTPSFVMDLESRMRTLTESEYARMSGSMWWQFVAKSKTSTGKRELLNWLLSTAMIRDLGEGGNMRFDDLVSSQTEYTHKDKGAGLRLTRNQLTDTDGGGMDLAGQWARDIGAYMAYWPQKQVATFLKTAHLLAGAGGFTAYDALAFFSASHPVNPYKTSLGTYSNLLSGGTAYPIHDAIDVDIAFKNLGKIFSHIASIKMPNGEDPRFLTPRALIVNPAMYPRAMQLTSADMIAMTAGGAGTAGGGADARALVQALGFTSVIKAPELAGFESDTTFFVVCDQAASSDLGPVIYSEREPFVINYYGETDESTLGRARELEWLCNGRNTVAAGHPYLLFKCQAT